jgi:hypothetical protein
MSTRSEWMVILGDDKLAVARIDGAQVELSDSQDFARENEPAQTAERIRALLSERHHSGRPVMLALGSSRCVSTTLPVASARQIRKRGAIGFLVEPYLPWSVEEGIIDYELLPGNRVFAVSAEARPLAAVVAALEERSIRVAAIAPLARLALEHHLRARSSLPASHVLLWRHEPTVDLWLVQNGRPALWNWLPDEASDVSRSLRLLALSEDVTPAVIGRNLPSDFLRAALADTGLQAVEIPALDGEDPLVAASQEAAAVLQGKRPAAIEFRRDQLVAEDRHRAIRRQLRLVQGTALLFLAALGIAFFNQARRMDLLRDAEDRQQTVLFQRLFPKERVPVAIHSRLQNEFARLKGVRGERADLPETLPFLAVLEPLLKSLPADLRYRILEMRIDNGQLYLVGQVRTHGDADRIAGALRGAGLEVGSPNTSRLEREGVEFRISAHVIRPDGKQDRQKAI